MKKAFLCIMAILLSATMANAIEIEGRSGQFPMSYALIDAISGYCYAEYTDAFQGNIYINSIRGDATTHVVINKKNAVATCKFIDTSGVFEANAEVGDIDGVCSLITSDGTFINGSGKVVAAANNGDQVTEITGGNTTIHCKFEIEED